MPIDSQQAAPHVLREYALIADGERAALLGPEGEIAWLCAPAFDSPAVIGSLLGAPGCYRVTPKGRYTWGGYYETGSLVWRNRWVTESGIVECREALASPGRPDRLVLLRRVTAKQGRAHLGVSLQLAAEFGDAPLRDLRCTDGIWEGCCGALRVRWTGAPWAHVDKSGAALVGELTLDEGASCDLVLELSTASSDEPVLPDLAWAATERAWEGRVPALDHLPAARDARHAVAVLSGLTSASGGMVAAATTSLPERAEQGRNYDYRYVWIRDQCYTGLAGARAGAPLLLDDAVRFVGARLLEHGDRLAPAYTTRGRPIPDQRQLDLPGYPGGRVVVGNQVNAQFQLDTFGEALQLFAAADELGRLDADGWSAAELAAAAIAQRHDEPDAGIWELGDDRWTGSRLACAAGLRQMARRAPGPRLAGEWTALADALVAGLGREAVVNGRWKRAASDDRLDAALLLGGLRGAVPPDDPRHRATLEALLQELADDGFLYRFRHDERPLADAEGAFLICGYWMAEALAQQGEHVEAARWFERTRAACGPPGLYTEEFDVGQRQLRGNLPQAFVHAELLHAAAVLAPATARPEMRRPEMTRPEMRREVRP